VTSCASIFFSIEWTHPWALLAAVAVVLLWGLRWLVWRAGRRVSSVACMLQSVVLLAIAVALAGPMVPRAGQAGWPWLVLHDASASMRGQAELAWPVGVAREEYAFAASLHTGRGAELSAAQRRQTHIAAALRLASTGRFAGVVIHTDGQVQDDYTAAAGALADARLPVFLVLADAPPADARIQNFTARLGPYGGRHELIVTVASNARQSRRLQIVREELALPVIRREDLRGVLRGAGVSPARGGEGDSAFFSGLADGAHNAGETPAPRSAASSSVVLLDRPLDLMPDDVRTIRAFDDKLPAGVVQYRAELSPADAFPENDTAQIVLPTTEQRIAVLADSSVPVPEWRAPYVDRFTPDAPPPDDAWLAYNAVLAFDPTGRDLRGVGLALERYVQAGGGLVLVGSGPFGSPADADLPLGRTLPLLTNPFERRPLKLFVVLDASGSMAESVAGPGQREQVKFHVAVEAVLSLGPHLTAADRLVVVTFANQPRRVYDSGDSPPDFTALKRALETIHPTGGTAVVPALESVADAPSLAGRQGLILLLSDLRTEPFDAAVLADTLRRADLSISVAALDSPGDDGPPRATPLHALADELHGPFVNLSTLDGLARVFAEFLRQGRGDGLRRDGPFDVTAVHGTSIYGYNPPPADAYFLTVPREGAVVLARAGDDPVLATQAVGLGRAVSLAVPVSTGQNVAWSQWEEWGAFLADQLGRTARPPLSSDYSAVIERRGDDWRIELVSQTAAGPVNWSAVTATVLSPAAPGQPAVTRRVPMAQIAPGRYELTVPAVDAAAVAVTNPSGWLLWRGLLPQLPAEEFQHLGVNQANLRRLADLTGGQIVSAENLPAHLHERHVQELTPIWWWFACVGVGLMLIEWALTRVWR